MTGYERRFYEDIHNLVVIQKQILDQIKEINKSIEKCVPKEEEPDKQMVLTEDDLIA